MNRLCQIIIVHTPQLSIAHNKNPDQLTEIGRDYRRYMDQLRAVIRTAEGRDRPVYISEIGWESRCVRDGAQLVKCMDAGLQAVLDDPSVALGIWFCTQDFEKEYGVYGRGPLQSGNRKSVIHDLT